VDVFAPPFREYFERCWSVAPSGQWLRDPSHIDPDDQGAGPVGLSEGLGDTLERSLQFLAPLVRFYKSGSADIQSAA